MGLILQARVEKQLLEWKYTDSPVKEKLSGTVVCKEDNADSVLGHEKTHYY